MLNILLILFSLAAGFLFWWATALHGIGIHSDSVLYLWVAESLSKGLGFGVANAFGQFTPVNLWPPLYPLLVCVCLWLSHLINPQVSAEQVATVLGILLSGASTWVFGRVVAKVSNRSLLFVSFGIVFLLSSPIFWDTYLYAMSEPLFIFLGLLALYFFLDYLRTYSNTTLFWAGLMAGLCLLTRYAGIYLIPVMGISIFFVSNRSLKRNFFAFSHITTLGLFPILLWGLRNYSIPGMPARQSLTFSPITSADWSSLWASLTDWFSPTIKIFNIFPLGLGVVLAFGLLLGSLVLYYKKRVYGNNESQEKWWKILSLCILSYSFFLISARLFFDPSIHLEESRMFFPIYLGLLTLTLSLLSNAEEIKYQVLRKYLFYAAFGTVIIFAVMYTSINFEKTRASLADSRENGLALNSVGFKNKAIWPALGELKLSTTNPIYFTDNVETLYWINKTPASILGDINPDLAASFQSYAAQHDVIIVLINHPETSSAMIKNLPSAQKVYQGNDGAIFIMHKTPAN